MDTEPPASPDSTAPTGASSDAASAGPTGGSSPVRTNTVPVTPADDTDTPPDVPSDEVLLALPMQKGDPDWSHVEPGGTARNGDATPEWAQTVPTSPGAAVESPSGTARITDPPKAVASDSTKSTWPPAAETAPAPPEETDIWPPEPPTERAMPAWPPPSELEEAPTSSAAVPEPLSADAGPVWPVPSFDAPAKPASEESEAEAPDTVEPAAPQPPAATAEPSAKPVPAEPAPEAAATPRLPFEPAPPAAESKPPQAAPVTPPATRTPSGVQPAAASAPPARRPTPPSLPTAASAPPPAPAPVRTPPPAPTPAPAATREGTSGAPAPSLRPAWAPAPPAPPKADEGKVDWPAPVQIPSWAPRIPAAVEPTTSHPGTPTWFSPKEEVRHTAQPVAQPAPAPQKQPEQPAAPQAATPTSGGQLPVAPAPAAAPAPPQTPSHLQAQAAASKKATWEVVHQAPKVDKSQGPTPEDRSYAEWFAWAKRGGAPASACHAAAQGAFAALTGGKDVATAVQWATAAMSRPPANVSYERQTYCAWFSLANIDLNFDQQRSHAFATAAVAALDAGQDASAAHAAGLNAIGIR